MMRQYVTEVGGVAPPPVLGSSLLFVVCVQGEGSMEQEQPPAGDEPAQQPTQEQPMDQDS